MARVLLSDPRLAEVPVRDCEEALVDVRASAPLRVARPALLRYGLVDRLVTAQSLLPRDLRLLIVDGHRSPGSPCGYAACAADEAELAPSDMSAVDVPGSVGVCATPPVVAPHPTGGAVDLTVSDEAGAVSLPSCCTDQFPEPSKATWKLLASALSTAGLVNYPARWWHWSHGDRFWAYTTQAPHARYGPTS